MLSSFSLYLCSDFLPVFIPTKLLAETASLITSSDKKYLLHTEGNPTPGTCVCVSVSTCVSILNMKLGEKRDEGVGKARKERKEVEYVFTSMHIIYKILKQ